MKVKITKQIGKSMLVFEVEGDKELDTLTRASTFTTMPDTCTMCNSENVELSANKADKYSFVKVKCMDCGAASTMGLYQDNSGAFWKKFEKYVASAQEGGKK